MPLTAYPNHDPQLIRHASERRSDRWRFKRVQAGLILYGPEFIKVNLRTDKLVHTVELNHDNAP